MDDKLAEEILWANIALHEKEAQYYDVFHPDIFCRPVAKRIGKAIALALAGLRGSRLQALDIGAGTGNITLKLSACARVETITAVDLSARMLAELEQKVQNSSQGARIETIVSEANLFLGQCHTTYDLITVSSVLHHIPDYAQALEHMIACLKPGGFLLIFLEPSGETSRLLRFLSWLDIRLFTRFFLAWEIYRASREFDYSLSDYHAYHGFSLEEITRFFRSHTDVSVIRIIRYNLFRLPVFRLAGLLFRQKNIFMMVIQKKQG